MKTESEEHPEAQGHLEVQEPTEAQEPNEHESDIEKEPKADTEKKAETDTKEDSEPDVPREMTCELALLDKKYDADGHKEYIKRKSQPDESWNWWRLYALAETRHYSRSGNYKYTRLHVNPTPLRQLLEDVIGDFPNEPIDAQMYIELDLPAHCLFFYREELEKIGTERFKDDSESLGHLKLLLDWIDRELKDAFKAHNRFNTSSMRPIDYENLWTIFKPGTLIYTKVLGQPRAFRARGFEYENDKEPCLAVKGQYVDYDGIQFGTREEKFRIPKFSGTMRCEALNVMPLDCRADGPQLRERLLARGQRFRDLAGRHFMHYHGVGFRIHMYPAERFSVNGRVVIDCATYRRFQTEDLFELEDLDRTEEAKRQRTMRRWNEGVDKSDDVIFDELLDEDLIVATSMVRGFAFTHRKFMEFSIDELSPIVWDESCFDHLVLDPTPKHTVRALVSMHAREGKNAPEAFDDIVKGKGKGLVMVLHGPPGVGKTLTAECVAESVHRPLYMVSAGDLGTDSSHLEFHLSYIMELTSTWGAVLLIDEADVFLEKRSRADMKRNAMVSVFLRVLEYYRGILFLTTNRVSSFDDAFTSRIHVPLRYTQLSEASRRTIWSNFCKRIPGGTDLSDNDLDRLARHELNGRQIKNIVKSAESMAAYENCKLDAARLEQFTKVQGDFERDWMGFVDINE
ncbi:P-loop containing nucleoside triphosphate hydrolase protein [Camillea tinctor]|nr:P-loop containing nucleoside triphosphate hydrolase protein [Camillea tinctor]